jgi:hypothetical protein
MHIHAAVRTAGRKYQIASALANLRHDNLHDDQQQLVAQPNSCCAVPAHSPLLLP